MKTLIQEMLGNAKDAAKKLEKYSQQDVDVIIKELALVVYKNAEELANEAVAETKMGSVKDKIIKNKMKSELICHHLQDVKTVGIINRDEEKGIIEIAEPVGIIAAIIPCTNPTVTAMSNSMFAIKSRSCIIIAPHPRAKDITVKTVKLMIEAGKKVGLPENAIQVITEPSKESSQELMKGVDFILATGGPGMVKAAYSSGKPSYGVGAGNVPAVIHDTADIEESVSNIIQSKIYDHGLICSSEQAVIVSENLAPKLLKELNKQGGYYVQGKEKDILENTLIKDGKINPEVIGQSVQTIAKLSGIELPKDRKIKLFVVPEDGVGHNYAFSKEKMSPVLAFYVTKDFHESVQLAVKLLDFEGAGHTASIHTNDEAAVIEYAHAVKVSRVLVNQPSSFSSGGSRVNSLTPTTTLGCGSWGGNAVTDNISAANLLNIKRVAFKLPKATDTSKTFESDKSE